MAIVASDISLSARHQAVQTHTVQQSLRIQVGSRAVAAEASGDQVSISEEALAALKDQEGLGGKGGLGQLLAEALDELTDEPGMSGPAKAANKPVEGPKEEKAKSGTASMDLKTQLFAMLFEKLTGRKFTSLDPEDLSAEAGGQTAANPTQTPPASPEAASGAEGGFGFAYDYSETHYESETMEFQAGGTIRTSDGQEIAFSVSVKMSREFYSSNEIHLRAGTLRDPLMLNFDGAASSFGEDRHFEFDLDGDGQTENLASLQEGSGLLGIDRNGNGQIDDGTELLGTRTGNAFGELAAYDSDGNGFIDEGDAAFDQLRVMKTSGEGETLDLQAAGVAGIGLAHVPTSFEMRNSQNQAQAFVRSTGVFLTNTGRVGTAQQIDFSV